MSAKSRRTETALWRADDLGAELLRGRFADFAYDLHTHDTACLALITAGSIRIRMKGSEFVAGKGDLYAIDADAPHAGWPVDDAGWCQRTIYVDLALLHFRIDGACRGKDAPSIRGPVIRDAGLTALFQDVHRRSEDGGSQLLRDERYLGFTRRLFERHVREVPKAPPVGREDRAVRLARAYLDQRLDERVSLAEIAAAANLPMFRLFRAFQRDMGMTPHAYQRQARIRLAVALIRQGNPLADVAAAAGFADQAHLTRCFYRRMGVTPGAYKAAQGS